MCSIRRVILGTRDVIDLDESNYKLETQNSKFRKVIREKRYGARGKYKKGEGSVSLLMAISGNEREGESFSFHRCFLEGEAICPDSTISYWSCSIGSMQIAPDGLSF
jgi:hypothetical protein